jgi:hypothetical protein
LEDAYRVRLAIQPRGATKRAPLAREQLYRTILNRLQSDYGAAFTIVTPPESLQGMLTAVFSLRKTTDWHSFIHSPIHPFAHPFIHPFIHLACSVLVPQASRMDYDWGTRACLELSMRCKSFERALNSEKLSKVDMNAVFVSSTQTSKSVPVSRRVDSCRLQASSLRTWPTCMRCPVLVKMVFSLESYRSTLFIGD